MAIFPHNDWPILPDDNGAAYRVGYFEGLREGVTRFAIHKNGEMIVGSCGTTLAEALAEIDVEEKDGNFSPRPGLDAIEAALGLATCTGVDRVVRIVSAIRLMGQRGRIGGLTGDDMDKLRAAIDSPDHVGV